MGYTTKFKGQFNFVGELPAETALRLMDLSNNDSDEQPKDSPGGYCQWELTKDRKGLKWDGGEKFYDYEKWLQYIVDAVLKPVNVGLEGFVQFAGEDVEDRGTLRIENGTVLKCKAPLVSDELDELKRFRDFVLKSEWKEEILDAWNRKK